MSVEGKNQVGLVSQRGSTDCALVDSTPPQITFVGVGLLDGTHTTTQSYTDLVFANVVATEDLSVITEYEWCICSKADGACDVTAPTAGYTSDLQPNTASLGKGSLILRPGSNFSVRVRARNSVGVWSSPTWSAGTSVGHAQFVLDAAKPAGLLFDATIPDYEKMSADTEAHELGEGDHFGLLKLSPSGNGSLTVHKVTEDDASRQVVSSQ